MDPKTSRWLSGDPALGEYIPSAPVNEEVRKRNGNLPGMGGVFNYVNLHLYHYAGNNPVKLVDPDGRITFDGDTIICDLTDRDDMEKARFAFNITDNVGRRAYNKVIATDGGGISITFNKWEDLGEYLGYGVTYDQIVATVNLIATEASLGSIGIKDIAPELSKSLGKIGNRFSVVSFAFALNDVINDPNWDTISDAAII